jgi:hypothetical protein
MQIQETFQQFKIVKLEVLIFLTKYHALKKYPVLN